MKEWGLECACRTRSSICCERRWSHREVTLSVEPPGPEQSWLEHDDPVELRERLAEADIVVTHKISGDEIALAPRLTMIQMPSVGEDQIDVVAAARSIQVAITLEGTIVGVAEHMTLMILALYKLWGYRVARSSRSRGQSATRAVVAAR